MRKRKPLPELPRVYVRPNLDRRQLEAKRAFFEATCRGERARPKPGTVDPLLMRLGLRASLIAQRAGWVVSNPGYSDSLDRHPENDPSLPGPAWLHEVYRWRDGRELCTLHSARSAIERRIASQRVLESTSVQTTTRVAAAPLGQMALFTADQCG